MSTTFVGGVTGRDRAAKAAKYVVRRILFPLGVLAPFAFFFPKTALFYAICGAYDLSRNTGMDLSTPRRYFIGNGFFTWLLSPLNILLDLLSLPYVNKGVYRLEDLPSAYQDEVRSLIRISNEQNLVAKLEERSKENQRTMIFFRWYGVNIDTFLDIPEFHQKWKYIQTIGVSVFNKKVSTSKHFGFMRASLRVLYNLNDMKDDSAYIVVGDTTHYWRENKLFIFDDTLLHQSFNETDQPRYCLFVDIVRPTPFPRLMSSVITGIRMLSQSFKFVYYKHWNVIDR
ncbi:MAG: aspartyl/asparaginyl beta-hydroxylase domain-containing protein [Xanthobacteraceae bacterium]